MGFVSITIISKYFDAVYPKIKEIYENYKFLELNDKDINDMVIYEIRQTLILADNKLPYLYQILFRFEKKLNKIINDEVQDDKECLRLLNNYINYNLSNLNSLSIINNLSEFINNYKIDKDYEFYIELIVNNKLLENALKDIFENYMDFGSIHNLDKVSYQLYEVYTYIYSENIPFYSEINKEENTLKEQYLDREIREYINSTKSPSLSLEEQKELAIKAKNGEILARNKLIETNLGIVNKYALMYRNNGVDVLDLIQEGNIALITAFEKYDINKNVRFSTYATYYVKNAITRALEREVHLKNGIIYENADDYLKVHRNIKSIIETYSGNITRSEIANLLNVDMTIVNIYFDDKYFEDLIEDELVGYDMENIVLDEIIREMIQELINNCNITDRERDIIIRRFGLDGKDKRTERELALEYQLSTTGINNIENNALKKIRTSSLIKKVIDLMDNPDKARKTIETYIEYYKGNNDSKNPSRKLIRKNMSIDE